MFWGKFLFVSMNISKKKKNVHTNEHFEKEKKMSLLIVKPGLIFQKDSKFSEQETFELTLTDAEDHQHAKSLKDVSDLEELSRYCSEHNLVLLTDQVNKEFRQLLPLSVNGETSKLLRMLLSHQVTHKERIHFPTEMDPYLDYQESSKRLREPEYFCSLFGSGFYLSSWIFSMEDDENTAKITPVEPVTIFILQNGKLSLVTKSE